MTIKHSVLYLLLTTIAGILLSACGQNHPVNERHINQLTLTIDTFSTFPPEIDGCACYFAQNPTGFNKGAYIYMNDYAQTSFMKINGVFTTFTMTTFTQVDSLTVKATYKSESYDMTIESKEGMQSGEETWLKTGTITVTNKKGTSRRIKFYGECGC